MSDDDTGLPQLPHAVHGVAYEDVMGGVSIDLCLDEDGDTDPKHLLERHTDGELVCIVPASEAPLALCKAAKDMLSALLCIDAHLDFRPGLAGRYDLLTRDERQQIKDAIAKARNAE